jgi:SAM-dependent methyltransferase
MLYGPDLSYVHHVGFGTFAERAAPGLLTYLRSARIESGLVVDLGCGSGIWAAHALGAGYDVLGVDVSPAMIEIARRVAPDADFMVASAHAVTIPRCVAVTAVGEGISYLADESPVLDIEKLLYRISDALVPGGLLIFDIVETSSDAPMRYEGAREGPDWKAVVQVHEDPTCRLLTRTIDIIRRSGTEARHTVEVHRLRTFDSQELTLLLATAGFEVQVTRRYVTVDLAPQRLGFVARKPRRVECDEVKPT